MIGNNELDIRFTYHAPKPEQVEKYTEIRATALRLAQLIDMDCPDSREKSLSLTALDEAVFWANAAIARRS